jgi:hypothetical protein
VQPFLAECQHTDHTLTCADCNRLELFGQDIDALLSKLPSGEARSFLQLRVTDALGENGIQAYIGHLARDRQQIEARECYLLNLGESEAFVWIDYSGKILPSWAAQSQSASYGLSGLSEHIAWVSVKYHHAKMHHLFEANADDDPPFEDGELVCFHLSVLCNDAEQDSFHVASGITVILTCSYR